MRSIDVDVIGQLLVILSISLEPHAVPVLIVERDRRHHTAFIPTKEWRPLQLRVLTRFHVLQSLIVPSAVGLPHLDPIDF